MRLHWRPPTRLHWHPPTRLHWHPPARLHWHPPTRLRWHPWMTPRPLPRMREASRRRRTVRMTRRPPPRQAARLTPRSRTTCPGPVTVWLMRLVPMRACPRLRDLCRPSARWERRRHRRQSVSRRLSRVTNLRFQTPRPPTPAEDLRENPFRATRRPAQERGVSQSANNHRGAGRADLSRVGRQRLPTRRPASSSRCPRTPTTARWMALLRATVQTFLPRP